jgi:hypothetical protein
MDWVMTVAVFVSVFASFMLGQFSADITIGRFKRENERLNAELRVLTKRDSKGRFTGGK